MEYIIDTNVVIEIEHHNEKIMNQIHSLIENEENT